MGKLKSSLLLLVLILAGCQVNSDRINSNDKTEIIIGAAASLQDVISQIKPLYEQQYPQQTLTATFASSGTLQRQINQGAPIDVFISADRTKIDKLDQQGLLIDSSIQNLVSNQIALVTTTDNPLELSGFKDLLKDKVKTLALGEPNTVPGGKYAQEVLEHYEIANQVKPKAVYAKDIRQVLNYVTTQNADVGMIYLTDARSRQQDLQIIAIAPLATHSSIDYAIAITQASRSPQVAENFVDFLFKEPAQTIFKQSGFLVLADN